MGRLDEKVVLITRGESGIGLATVRLFVAEGARVHVVGLDESKLAATAGEFGDDRVLCSVADVNAGGAPDGSASRS
jgi:NADP-dependent 3-hydroxy acid dehydrogenase YdfG